MCVITLTTGMSQRNLGCPRGIEYRYLRVLSRNRRERDTLKTHPWRSVHLPETKCSWNVS